MIKLTIDQQKKLLEMLLDDENFSAIRKELNVGERYNLKSLCEYYGGKLYKAYKLHRNNYREEKNINDNKLTIIENTSSEFLSKEDFFKSMSILSSQIKSINIGNNLLEESNQKEDKIENNIINEIVINTLPKVLPDRLQGENYRVKQTSVKVVENVYNEFTEYCKGKKGFSTIELHSLALLEFLEKYRA